MGSSLLSVALLARDTFLRCLVMTAADVKQWIQTIEDHGGLMLYGKFASIHPNLKKRKVQHALQDSACVVAEDGKEFLKLIKKPRQEAVGENHSSGSSDLNQSHALDPLFPTVIAPVRSATIFVLLSPLATLIDYLQQLDGKLIAFKKLQKLAGVMVCTMWVTLAASGLRDAIWISVTENLSPLFDFTQYDFKAAPTDISPRDLCLLLPAIFWKSFSAVEMNVLNTLRAFHFRICTGQYQGEVRLDPSGKPTTFMQIEAQEKDDKKAFSLWRPSWRRLGGVLGVCWGVLGAS